MGTSCAGRPRLAAELGPDGVKLAGRRVAGEHLEHPRVLVAEQELDGAVLVGLEARRVPRYPRNSAYSLGVRVASTDHCSVIVAWMLFTRASRFSASRRSSASR